MKTISKKKKCKMAKWQSEEALQRAEKEREAKGKGEKERYTHLNAEFQRIERRDKKAFLSDQCKEIEENTRMGKRRDLFKKISPKPLFQNKSSDLLFLKSNDQNRLSPALQVILSLLASLWNSAFKWVYLSSSPLLFVSLLFIAICKAASDSHFAFLHFFLLGIVLIPVSCTMS